MRIYEVAGIATLLQYSTSILVGVGSASLWALPAAILYLVKS